MGSAWQINQPRLLQLHPTGAKVAGRGLHPLENSDLARRTIPQCYWLPYHRGRALLLLPPYIFSVSISRNIIPAIVVNAKNKPISIVGTTQNI
jgi:hypothetical protein